jgi:hypothetical protein
MFIIGHRINAAHLSRSVPCCLRQGIGDHFFACIQQALGKGKKCIDADYEITRKRLDFVITS